MSDDPNHMTCPAFQAQLPDLIATGEDVSSHPHLQSCAVCRQLLAELETIAEAARQLFPIVEPPDELWEHIESAIQSEKIDPASKTSDAKDSGTAASDLSAEPA